MKNYFSPYILPHILSGLIRFIGDDRQSLDIGIFFASTLIILTIIRTLALEHYYNLSIVCGARTRNSLIKLIYKKVKLFNKFNKIQTVAFNYDFRAFVCQTIQEK